MTLTYTAWVIAERKSLRGSRAKARGESKKFGTGGGVGRKGIPPALKFLFLLSTCLRAAPACLKGNGKATQARVTNVTLACVGPTKPPSTQATVTPLWHTRIYVILIVLYQAHLLGKHRLPTSY